MRAPLAPIGWPSATAPPFTFTFSGFNLSWRVTAIAATANASFSSTRSTSFSRSQPVFRSSFSTASTGAIVRSRRISRGDSAVLFERGLQLRQRFHRGIFSRRLVIFNDQRIAFFLWHFNWQNLRFEKTRLPRPHRLLVRFYREAVLLFASDAVFFCDQLASNAHMKIFVGVPQAVVNHAVHDFLVAEPIARARVGQKIRAVGHGLHAARDNNF